MGHMACQGASDWSELKLIAKRKRERFSHKFACCKHFLNESYPMVYNNVIDVS